MLDERYRQEFLSLSQRLDCGVVLPDEWNDRYFQETGVAPTSHYERRGFVRHLYRMKAVLSIEQTLPSISREADLVAVYCRDISRTGIGFLHAAQLYPGETGRLMLPTHAVTITVAGCRKFNSQCYLIGARFRSESDGNGAEQN
jgi:PilZ domain